MNLWTLKDLANICNGYILCGDENIICNTFSKDTRTIKPNDIYIGIKGETFDGNEFYNQAFKNKASACILEASFEDKITNKDNPILIVENSVEALKLMAIAKLKEYNIPLVAVTGSVGKTSTKEMIYSVMSKKYKVLKTEGNENNDIGLPLTILRLKDHTAAIIEMGMNHLNEISYLSKIANPDLAVITNVTSAHIGNLGSMENILKAKLEIIDGLKENGTLIINNDNEYLKKADIKVNKFTCGINEASDIKATNIEFKNDLATFDINYNNQINSFKCNFKTEPFILNSLLAIAVGIKLNIDMSDIKGNWPRWIC